jgi:GNAT superfamily N-acetyltransferase
MPDDYLDALSVDDRASVWRESLANDPRPRSARFVAEAADGSIVGFVIVGPARSDPESDVGEVYAINVDPSQWGSGAGTELLAAATEFLGGAGFGRAVLWVHSGNRRAREFYTSRGWSDDRVERQQDLNGAEVPETRYSRPLT